jgi:hypothetical protein
MRRLRSCVLLALAFLPALAACRTSAPAAAPPVRLDEAARTAIERGLSQYTTVRLTTDVQALSPAERRMIPLLIEAAREMDAVFWQQAYGDRDALLASLPTEDARRFARINYGPWDRLRGNAPFLPGVGPKPAGARFYPADITKAEFDDAAAQNPALRSLYTLVRRRADGSLGAVAYHEAYAPHVTRAAAILRQAAALAEDAGLRRYLELRAEALLTDNYQPSDLAWLDMKSNTLDFIVGPIETYEDGLYGYKAAHSAYVLVKDRDWSARLARYAALLPGLQRGLPVPEAYKRETPGADSDLGAYDVIYYAGDSNAGSKTIAVNLPNDEQVQLQKGTRRLQLKNAMRAKFDEILVPIARVLIAPEQRPHVTFDAFFANTMFHEVAHGLGIKNTITGRGTVREALRDQASALEEGKADVLGLYMVASLAGQGELGQVDLRDYYTTFVASIFRSIRFGAASAHGKANLLRFNFFKEMGAFTRDAATGTYRVDYDRIPAASNALSERILRLQGDGDYDAVAAFVQRYSQMDATLQADLARLAAASIPVDVVFEQGTGVFGL